MAQTLDVFPAIVKWSDEATTKSVRVIVRDAVAYVFSEIKGTVRLVASAPVTAVTRSKTAPIVYTLTTDAGSWEVSMGGGCGCGSKLKGFSFNAVVAAGVQQ